MPQLHEMGVFLRFHPYPGYIVMLNIEAVDSTVLVCLVHAVLVAPFSVSFCNSFLSGAHLSVLPGGGFVPL